MTPPKGICVECGREIPGHHNGIREIHAYADERHNNSIREMRPIDGRIWHSSCFAMWLRKFNDQGKQGGLL